MKYIFLLLISMNSYVFSSEFDNALELAKNTNDVDAQIKVAFMYDLGLGTSKDFHESMKWWKKVANQGNADAQYRVGAMYDIGSLKVYDKAIKWYKKAAKNGHSAAQGILGKMYENGDGVEVDYIKAYIWKSMASKQGNLFEKSQIETFKNKMTKEQIAKGQELASMCWESKFKDCD